MKKTHHHNFSELLKSSGHKATPGRLAILDTLEKAEKPLSISDISKRLKKDMDQVTIYRSLEALTNSGIIVKVDFQHPHAHYEFVEENNHHHHLICKICGAVEDIENVDAVDFEKVALKKSKMFDSIKTHSLEFFGVCNKCAKKSE